MNLMNDVKKEIQDQCPLNLRQVEAFLENYSCVNNATQDLMSPTTSKNRIHIPNIEDMLTLSPQIGYIDEDNELKFIGSNKNLFNNTEQTVYVVC